MHACDRRTDGRTGRIMTPKTALAYDRVVKTKRSLFDHPLRALRCNVRTPSMVRWKARGLFVVIELFSLSHTVETLWAEIGRSRRFSKGSGSLWAQISEGRGRHPPTTVGIRVAEWLPFVRYQNIGAYAVRHLVLSQSTRVTDGQTDRITIPKTALAYARAVKQTHTNELKIR